MTDATELLLRWGDGDQAALDHLIDGQSAILWFVRVGQLKRHWNRLGRRDPLWAALTDSSKRGGRWNVEDFFRQGSEEVAAVLSRAEQLGILVSRRNALDFGCGAGRITQALADRFERCDGVDISTVMLRAARLHNRHPERCLYHLNTTADLRRFSTAAFTFAYSTLVLQHMAPSLSARYLGELLRVLVPGGLLVFQMPSHRAATEPPETAARTQIAGPLPEAACRARLRIDASALALQASQEVAIKVSVENASPHVWAALADVRGGRRINLANRWLDEDGEVLHRDDARCPLPHDVSPGMQVELMLGVNAPAFDGIYHLELDLVQENVGWFGERGSPTLRIPCRVSGGMPARPSQSKVVAVLEAEPLFRDRHPRLFAVLRATRIRDVYWAWRRALDRVKGQRDRAIVSLRRRAYEPVVPPLINWWRGRPFAPKMEMHCVPKAEVLATLAAHGGRVVYTEEELMPGGFQSCRYWVVKE
jgi:SAM-dependent methyltransferase